MPDSEDFENFNDSPGNEEWDEDRWEKFFQREDEQKRKLEELLEKYGFSEKGLRLAFEEMGYQLPEESGGDGDEEQSPEEPEENIDEILEKEYGEWALDMPTRGQLGNAHPLFSNTYELILKILKMLRHINVGYKDHPIVIFQSGLFESMSKLIRAGYDDLDYKMEAERGLILAALKRARKSLYISLLTIPKLDEMKILSYTTQNLFRNEITNLLKEINQEILFHKKER